MAMKIGGQISKLEFGLEYSLANSEHEKYKTQNKNNNANI
jgi:hypothetical protein